MNKSLEIVNTPFGNFIIDEYDLIGNFIKNYKTWEYHLYEIYSRMITKDHYCIDAGANLGFHSVQFGFLGKKVYSFEPQSYVYNQLCTNILFNDLNDIIETYKVGLGDKEEVKQLWNIEHENWVGNGMHNWGGRGFIQEGYGGDRATNNEYREEDVIKLISLDSLEINRCDFMKVDVQGYEFNLFKGAKNLIANNIPVLFLENPPSESTSKETKDYLVDLGYDFYRLNIGNNEDCILLHPSNTDYSNHKDVIEEFKTKYNIIQE